jgi:hypothetical protein
MNLERYTYFASNNFKDYEQAKKTLERVGLPGGKTDK